MSCKYKEVEKYIEKLNEVNDINTLKRVYGIIKRGGCTITMTNKCILCYIDKNDVIDDILDIKYHL